MKARMSGALVALLLLSSVPALADEVSRTIHIEVIGTPKFDVVYHRALTNATGAVFGGLIGAGIQAGIESDKDAQKRKALEPHVAQDVWDDAFVKTLNDSLAAKGFEPLWGAGKGEGGDGKADLYLVLYPDSYGFRMVNSDTFMVSAYVEFKGVHAYRQTSPKDKRSKENFYLTGRKQGSFDDLEKDPSAINADVAAVLAQAARRLANKIIYNVK